MLTQQQRQPQEIDEVFSSQLQEAIEDTLKDHANLAANRDKISTWIKKYLDRKFDYFWKLRDSFLHLLMQHLVIITDELTTVYTIKVITPEIKAQNAIKKELIAEAIKIALDEGSLNIQNKSFQTPLHTAAINGNLVACEMLIEAGAEVDMKCAASFQSKKRIFNVLAFAAQQPAGQAIFTNLLLILKKHNYDINTLIDNRGHDAFYVFEEWLCSDKNAINRYLAAKHVYSNQYGLGDEFKSESLEVVKVSDVPYEWKRGPLSVVDIVQILKNNGYEAFVVGISPADLVRNSPLETDTDIITNATTEQLLSIPKFKEFRLSQKPKMKSLHTFHPKHEINVRILFSNKLALPDEVDNKSRNIGLYKDLMTRLVTICAYAADIFIHDTYGVKVVILAPGGLNFLNDVKNGGHLRTIENADMAIENEPQGIFLIIRHAARVKSIEPDIEQAVKENKSLLTFISGKNPEEKNDFVNHMKAKLAKLLFDKNAVEHYLYLRDWGIFDALYPQFAHLLNNSIQPKYFIDVLWSCPQMDGYRHHSQVQKFEATCKALDNAIKYYTQPLSFESHSTLLQHKADLQFKSNLQKTHSHLNYFGCLFAEDNSHQEEQKEAKYDFRVKNDTVYLEDYTEEKALDTQYVRFTR